MAFPQSTERSSGSSPSLPSWPGTQDRPFSAHWASANLPPLLRCRTMILNALNTQIWQAGGPLSAPIHMPRGLVTQFTTAGEGSRVQQAAAMTATERGDGFAHDPAGHAGEAWRCCYALQSGIHRRRICSFRSYKVPPGGTLELPSGSPHHRLSRPSAIALRV